MRSFAVDQFGDMSSERQLDELRKIADRHTLRGMRTFLTLRQGAGLVRGLDFPVEVKDRIRSAVELQVESLSPWPSEDIYWDMAWRSPAKDAKSVTVTVAIVPRDALDPWIDLFNSAGLPPSGFSFSTMAWAHASSILWSDHIPTILLGLEPDYAEGTLVHGNRITSIGLAEGGSGADRADKILRRLTSLSRVPSLEDVRTLACGSAIETLDQDNPPIPIEGGLAGSGKGFGAVAAALTGLGDSPFSANLVPTERRLRRNQLELIPIFALLALIVLAGSMLILREPYQWSAYASELDAAISTIAPTVRDLTDQETELNALSEKYRALGAHLNGRDLTLEALGELVGVLPYDTWLSAFTLRENDVTISGFSSSASELQRLIEESPRFENAVFANSVSRDEAGRDRFTMRFVLAGGL
jgi:hypothetical protein